LLNQSRIQWDAEAEAVFLLRPIADPKNPERVLFLKPGHADLIMQQLHHNHELNLERQRRKRTSKGIPTDSLDGDGGDDHSDEDEDDDEMTSDNRSGDGSGSGGGINLFERINELEDLALHEKSQSKQNERNEEEQEEEEEEEDVEISYELPENQCLKCKQLSLQLIKQEALWVCPRCGNMEDWADAPLDMMMMKMKSNCLLPPEELIYRRRIKGDGSGPVAWYAIDKTDLYLKLPRHKVDEAKHRLHSPDPNRLTGFKTTPLALHPPPPTTTASTIINNNNNNMESMLLEAMRPVTAPHPRFKIVAIDVCLILFFNSVDF
jgi:hypothetical protein